MSRHGLTLQVFRREFLSSPKRCRFSPLSVSENDNAPDLGWYAWQGICLTCKEEFDEFGRNRIDRLFIRLCAAVFDTIDFENGENSRFKSLSCKRYVTPAEKVEVWVRCVFRCQGEANPSIAKLFQSLLFLSRSIFACTPSILLGGIHVSFQSSYFVQPWATVSPPFGASGGNPSWHPSRYASRIPLEA